MSRTSSPNLPVAAGHLPYSYRVYPCHRQGQTLYLPQTDMTRNQRYESNGGHPRAALLKKQQERMMREAYKKENKIESYLADDENFPSFASQLKQLGLQLRDIPADGNCLFRALGDQFEGHGRNHYQHRLEVVKYMTEHRKDFEPFVEDDVPFDDHIHNLKKLGTHAGNDAIVAFARLHNVNVTIHQLSGKPLLIQGPSNNASVRQLHIAYHNGDHYSSIRRDGDNTESPANIRLQSLQETSKLAGPAEYAVQDYVGGSGVVTAKRSMDQLEKEVMRATGCQKVATVQETLQDCDYDVDATIATLLQTLELGDDPADDTTSLASQRTADSGIWSTDGTGTRIFGEMSGPGTGIGNVLIRDDSNSGSSSYSSHSSLSSNRGGGARPKLAIPSIPGQHHTANERKVNKKKRAEERHRQQFVGADPNHLHQEDTVVITQEVTRI